jgi:ppGpp synthetase/RelA/SpoT-type nucleotidyltranferase
MSDQYIALQLQTTGSKLEPNVLQLLRDSKLSELCYAYKIRTKSESKLLSKVQIKKVEKHSYALTDITDVIGIRLVALFKNDMVDLLEGILSAINHSNGIQPNPFIKDRIEEIIIYKGNAAFDDLTPRLLEVITKSYPSTTITEKHSVEGYSSIHIVSRLSTQVPNLNDYYLPIEIQIRTVFEDAWGEIDHKYGYVIRTGKDTGKPINNPQSVLAHLKVLKKFADACNEYADCIRSEAVGFPVTTVSPRKVISVASDTHILTRFAALNVPDNFIEKYKAARDLKDKAIASTPNNQTLFLDAAEAFRELAESFAIDQICTDYGITLAYYYARMNEAICLMSTNDREHVNAARNIYKYLDENPQYSQFPLLKMRHGQALSKLGVMDEAINLMELSGSLLKSTSDPFLGRPENEWPDSLPYADYLHMAKTQPKLLGYYIWSKIKLIKDDNEQVKFDLFLQAYSLTLEALDHVETDSPEELSLHNNLLYYAMGCLSRSGVPDINISIKNEELKTYVDKHIGYIETHLGKVTIFTADTLMKAYWLLNRKVDATKYAKLVVDSCVKESLSDLDDSEKISLIRIANCITNNQDIGVIN